MRHSILFAIKDPALEQEFRAYCQNPQSEWTPVFAANEQEALSLFAQFHFSAVVGWAHAEEFSGVELLNQIMQRHPQVHRIVISDPADTRNTLRCIGKGHHHLLAPCSAVRLRHALAQPYGAGTWRPSQATQTLMGQMRRVPSPPRIYFQILAELESHDAWVEKIGDLIAQDPAITAKVLQLANSAVFGLHLEVSHPRDAVAYIGLETTRSLVLVAHTFSSFDRLDLSAFSVDSLWRHSVAVGRFARRIARVEKSDPGLEAEAFTAGLLHDIGKLLFAANVPKPFGEALVRASQEHRFLWEIENEMLGATHAELGACLLATWSLPAQIIEAVAWHHGPGQCPENRFNALTTVHCANTFAHEASPESSPLPASRIEMEYLKRLGALERVQQWRHHCHV